MNLGQRLLTARKSLELTQENVEQKTGIATSSLSEFENGKREPSLNQLDKLSRCYHRSLASFLETNLMPEPVVLWRERPEVNLAKLQELKFILLCEQYKNLEIWCNDFIKPQIPMVEIKNGPFDYQFADNLAQRVRRELNLGDRPAFMLLKSLENDCGIKIFHDNFEPTGTAVCVRNDSFGMAVLLNSGNTPERRNFDLAHELFHLLIWDAKKTASITITSEEEEKLAGAFASYLLLPSDVVKRSVSRHLKNGKLDIELVPEIASEFSISEEALLWGIYRVFNMNNSQKDEIKKLVTDFREEYERKDSLTNTLQKYPDRYRALAIRSLNMGEISTGKFMEYLEVSRREAMNYFRNEEEVAGEVQIITS
jgi:XRE family transcriptional regulator, fatty acid utilization regulator